MRLTKVERVALAALVDKGHDLRSELDQCMTAIESLLDVELDGLDELLGNGCSVQDLIDMANEECILEDK